MVRGYVLTESEIKTANNYLNSGAKSPAFYVMVSRLRKLDNKSLKNQMVLIQRVTTKFRKEKSCRKEK